MIDHGDEKSYVFLDESGKPEVYSRKGRNLVELGLASRYLVIAAVRTSDQLAVQEAATALRLEILKDRELSATFSTAYSLNAFHAQTDYPPVKKRFYEWILNCPLDLKITVIVAEKLKAYSHLQQNTEALYATVAGQLLKRVLHTAESIEVIFSRREASLKALKNLQLVIDNLRLEFADQEKIELKTQIVYKHHPHYTHGGLQVADYIAHAVFQVFENNERKWWEIIKNRVGYVQDIFNKKSYSRSNPL